MDVTSGSSTTSNTSSTEGVCEYSYDKSRGSTISDISFKVDGTVFDRLNIDFTGVEARIELSCEALSRFRFGFGSSSEKNILFLIGSLESSTVFSTICFSGSIIGLKIAANAVERLVKSRDKRASFRTRNELAKRHTADKLLAEARKRIVARYSTLGERAAATAVWAAMKTKTKFGMGLKTAAGVAKAVNDSKAVQHQLQELQRHNRVMKGRGVYLAPYKRGRGVARRKKNEMLKLPKGVTTNVQLQQLANRMRIPYFRGEIAPYISTVSAIFDRRRNSNDIW
ncbi:hypothetical protein ALC60_12126 [Trachymyrmex zeteki]|uniref:Uncharacterized protein n=1 Tax=Mycetomoellerius zeteki TaxID=64791 RepID=A0A151WLZ8_9HYME|nr:hypothetical protein ALC60_12126 [Trachymyrmex zeteki]